MTTRTRCRAPYYTAAEDAKITAMVAAGQTLGEIATALGRPKIGIRYRAKRLMLDVDAGNNDNRRWTAADDALIAELATAGGTVKQAAKQLGRSPVATLFRCRRLGCTGLINDAPSTWKTKSEEAERETLWGDISLASHRLPLNQIAQALAA